MADTTTAPKSLYESDFYLWTKAQAKALRERSANALDYDLLAEEIEDMGERDLREVLSRITTILEHLYKLAWSGREEPRGGWKVTIATQRNELRRVLKAPSLRPKAEAELEQLHLDALKPAGLSFDAYEPAAPRDPTLRWSLPEILGEADDPIA